MTLQHFELGIASEFADTPGPRKRSEGQFSGEEFLETFLRPRFVAAMEAGGVLRVNLDGGAGYPTSFLEEAFGGLAREFGTDKVQDGLEFISLDEPYQEDDIRRYIRDANKR